MIAKLQASRAEAPRRRFRGQRRYFRRVARDASTFRLPWAEFRDYDLWHYHADWPGWGNRSWKYRLEHLRALAQVFTTIAEHASSANDNYQLWIALSGRDAGEDAVYLHTTNSGSTPFPLHIPFTDSRFPELERTLAELLPGFNLAVRESRVFDDSAEPPRETSSFFIQSTNHGLMLSSR